MKVGIGRILTYSSEKCGLHLCPQSESVLRWIGLFYLGLKLTGSQPSESYRLWEPRPYHLPSRGSTLLLR